MESNRSLHRSLVLNFFLLLGCLSVKSATFDLPVYTRTNALSPGKLLIVDGNGRAAALGITTNEAGYLSGVTSALQTQLNSKGAATNGTFIGPTITAASYAGSIASTNAALTTPAITGATLTGTISGGTFTNGTFGGNGAYLTNLDGGYIQSGTISNAQVAAAAAIVDTKLATISTAGKVENSATTAASANTASAIVARDGSGNFTAGTITATAFSGSGAAITGISPGNIVSNGTYIPNGALATNSGTLSGAFLSETGTSRQYTLNAGSLTNLTAANIASGTAGISITGNAVTATTATNSPGGNIDSNLALKAPLASPTFTGIVTATNIANALGLVGTPSYTFTGDTDTGLWSSGANTLNFSTGGSERVRVDSSGRLCIGSTAGAQLITINSDASLAAMAFQIGSSTKAFYGVSYNADDPIVGMTSGDLGFRVQSNDIFWSGNSGVSGQLVLKSSGNVGIGGITPSYLLDIIGAARISGTAVLNFGGTSGSANATSSIGETAANALKLTSTATTVSGTLTASGNLITSAGRVRHVKAVTTTYTLDTTTTDEIVIGNHATVAFTITIPDATAGSGATYLGREVWFKNKGAAEVTVSCATGSQIFTTSAVASVVLATGDSLRLICDGVVWNNF